MTDIYEETETYQAPVYDDYHEYESNDEDEFYEDYDTYPEEELIYHENDYEAAQAHAVTGKGRVLRLLLMLMLILLIVAVVIFGIVPYVDAMTQAVVPALPPAVQT